MDSVETIALAVGGGVILVVILLVAFRRPMGGSKTGYIDPGGGTDGD